VAEKKLALTPSERQKLVAATRDEIRGRINGVWLVEGIVDTIRRLERGEEPSGGESVPLDAVRVSSLSSALQARFKLLGKVLPDLKAVEVTGADGERLAPEMNRTELAARMLFLLRSQGVTVEGELEPAEPEVPDFLNMDKS